jgi:hypothetical protein
MKEYANSVMRLLTFFKGSYTPGQLALISGHLDTAVTLVSGVPGQRCLKKNNGGGK